jgi:hypothetical protein
MLENIPIVTKFGAKEPMNEEYAFSKVRDPRSSATVSGDLLLPGVLPERRACLEKHLDPGVLT